MGSADEKTVDFADLRYEAVTLETCDFNEHLKASIRDFLDKCQLVLHEAESQYNSINEGFARIRTTAIILIKAVEMVLILNEHTLAMKKPITKELAGGIDFSALDGYVEYVESIHGLRALSSRILNSSQDHDLETDFSCMASWIRDILEKVAIIETSLEYVVVTIKEEQLRGYLPFPFSDEIQSLQKRVAKLQKNLSNLEAQMINSQKDLIARGLLLARSEAT